MTEEEGQRIVEAATARLLAEHPPKDTEKLAFLNAQWDAGLAYVHYPEGYGGLGAPVNLQGWVDETLRSAGAPANGRMINAIAAGQGSASILAFGTEHAKQKYLRPLFTAEMMGCQLYSEPGSGSDLASLATRAVRDGDEWVVNGQKVWTSGAQRADMAILLARTNPDVPKHEGLTQFCVDMRQPGVDVRPLRNMGGGAEFNEVFLTDVRIPDSERLGDPGEGWKVSQHTLVHERYNMPQMPGRGEGAISGAVEAWQKRADKTSAAAIGLKDELMRHWVDMEILRLLQIRAGSLRASGSSGPEGSLGKLAVSVLQRRLSEWGPKLLGPEGMIVEGGYTAPEYDAEAMAAAMASGGRRRGMGGGSLSQACVGSPGISIAGGTDQIQRNIIGDRVLGLTREPAADRGVPWSQTLRN